MINYPVSYTRRLQLYVVGFELLPWLQRITGIANRPVGQLTKFLCKKRRNLIPFPTESLGYGNKLTYICFAERTPFHYPGRHSSITLTWRHQFTWPPRVLPETRHVFQVETWLLRVVNPDETPPMLSLAKISMSGGGASGSAPLCYGRTWVYVSLSVSAGSSSFFRFIASHAERPASSLSLAQHSAPDTAAKRTSAARSRVIPCAALRCGALQCCTVLRKYQVSYESTRYQGMYMQRI